MKRINFISILLVSIILTGCATVNITKTAKGYFEPTKPDDIEILMIVPNRDFTELATVTTSMWQQAETAKMHNSLRAKSAPLGANAVILNSSGIDQRGFFWTSGVAVRYKNK